MRLSQNRPGQDIDCPDPHDDFQAFLAFQRKQNIIKKRVDRPIDFNNLTINDFDIFTTLGKLETGYCFLTSLGTGTFGRVRQVQILGDRTKKIYALKMLKKTEIVRLNQVEHIKSEKKILMKIKHPFIVNMYSSSSSCLS